MANIVEEFNENRSRLNNLILEADNKVIKRIFNLDTNAFMEGALDVPTKELIGLVASLVLWCNDCIKYHLGRCHAVGLTKEQTFEALAIGQLIGGTIVIPHLRRAAEYWDALESEGK